MDFIEENIQKQIADNFSNSVVSSVRVLSQENYNNINVIIKYSIENTGMTDEVELNFFT